MSWNTASKYKPPVYTDVLASNGKRCFIAQWYGEENGGWATHDAVEVLYWDWLPPKPKVPRKINAKPG